MIRAKRALFFYLATARAGAIGRDSAAAIMGRPHAGFKATIRRVPSLVNRLTSSISKSHWKPYPMMSHSRQVHSDFRTTLGSIRMALAAGM
jgi:hypothetical protein